MRLPWVNKLVSAEHGAEAFNAFGAKFLLELETQFGVWVGKTGYALAEGLYVEPASSNSDNGVVGLE